MQSSLRGIVVGLVTLACAWVPAAGQAAPRKLVDRYEPYIGTVGGAGWPVYRSRFAVPACIVNAESHGYVHEHSHPGSSSGLYQISLGTWDANGGRKYATYPFEANKLQQSIVASRIWAHGRGAGQWSTAARCGF